jgi:transcriptional regulator with XRE-family HTH domain
MPHPIDIHVGNRLKQRRHLCGMSQSELAEKAGITFQQVQKYERGTNRMSASRLYEFSQILGVNISYFFEGLPAAGAASTPLLLASGMAEETAAFEHEPHAPIGGREAMELMRSFQKLTDNNLRKSVVSFVRNVAEGKPTLEE